MMYRLPIVIPILACCGHHFAQDEVGKKKAWIKSNTGNGLR
ncbi:hypothetical protein A1Q_1414 [Vibrio campbellii HY01]|nr:hypothetical protein A1Q_1414 [Vibrio campbellii HY01]